jgi:FO synthase
MDENISRAAGATHGQMMSGDDFRSLVEPLGRHLRQRSTLYTPVGGPPPRTPEPVR